MVKTVFSRKYCCQPVFCFALLLCFHCQYCQMESLLLVIVLAYVLPFFFQLHYSLYLRIKVVPIWYLSQNSNPMLCRNCFSSFCPNYRGCNTWPELCDKNWSICSYPVQHSLFFIQVLY